MDTDDYELVKEYDNIHFRLIEIKDKSNVYSCIRNSDSFLLGVIKWNEPLDNYDYSINEDEFTFQFRKGYLNKKSDIEFALSTEVLRDVLNFIIELKEDRTNNTNKAAANR